MNSTWLHFEAGALARLVDRTLVCIYAVGVEASDLQGPLAQFQLTRAEHDDTYRLVATLNGTSSKPIPDVMLADAFDLWWPRLQGHLASVMSAEAPREPLRSDQDQISEILTIVRELARGTKSPLSSSHPVLTSQAVVPSRPRLFIGSSTEGLSIAEAIQVGLDEVAECTVWTQGTFLLSDTTTESIVNAAVKYDFAVLILTADDMLEKKGDRRAAPRDNILFELGLFTGALGRARTFMVYSRDAGLHLPTDLAGVTAALYSSARIEIGKLRLGRCAPESSVPWESL